MANVNPAYAITSDVLSQLERINSRVSANTLAPVCIGSIRVDNSNSIIRNDFVGSQISLNAVADPNYLSLTIPTSANDWGFFSPFNRISAVFTCGEYDNVISNRVIQDVPINGDLEWRMYSVDNSSFLVGEDNPSIIGTYDNMETSITFFGHYSL